MDRSEIMELRRLFKTYKEESCPVNGFSRGFIDAEGGVKTCDSIQHFHDLKNNDVKKRVFTLASKTISNNAVTLSIKSGARNLFEKINAEKGKNLELFTELCERIASAIKESGSGNTYAVHLISYTYDPPAKTKDHKTIIDGVSDEIYSFFVAMVLPVKTTKPSYGYFSEEKLFAMNPLQRVVDNPVCGFVYPDFTDRTSDFDSVLYFRTEKMDISGSLFGEEAPALPEKEKKIRTPEIEETEVLKDDRGATSDIKSDPVQSKNDMISSLDSGSLSLEETHGRDITDERKSMNDGAELAKLRENDAKGESVRASVQSGHADIGKTRKNKVRISGNTRNLAKRMIDGVMCFVVPVSDADLSIEE